ncbi:copper resistance protein CopC/CopD [Natronosporangium hydrolyticum]|uniref:Copper resistance protein CopC/CopD n=1 Tax=Natronosporangium hydrolyticum TaxID=2811111 RepID=A0A895YC32_9ACTN|nr:copper resistance protein CopC [Natronosporangium hydrolyticum]QSB13772.1 copper resistance protein CopC/CopD [Natronosporangium hydrolyticum]
MARVTPTRIHRLASVLGGLVLGAFVAVGLLAAPASAHANLLGTDPANGSVVSQPPEQIVLTFSEPVRLIPDRITVVAPDGEPVPLGEPRVEGTDVVVPVERVTTMGTYLVSYRVISQDSHPVGGSITYSVGAPSEPPELPDQSEELTEPAVAAAMSINKFVGYAGLVLVVGPAVMLAVLWPRRLSRRGATRLVWAGLGLIGVSTVVAMWVQAPYSTGQGLFEASMADLREVFASTYGTALVVRLGVLVSAALLLRPLLAGHATRSDLLLLGGLGVAGMSTWSFTGHSIASPIPAVSVVVNTVHVAAAAFWIGGLVVLAGFLLRLASERELGVILPEWSRWAALSVSGLLLAGLIMAVVEIGPPEALWTTRYGLLLLGKIILVAVVIAVAGYSRKLVRQRLGASRPGAMRLAVIAEAVVLAGVLAVSAVLVQTTPGRTEAAAPPVSDRTDFVTSLESPLYQLEVTVDPASQGSNTVHLYAYDLDGEPQRVEEWTATATLPEGEIEAMEIPLLALTDNHALGDIVLPAEGDWEFRFTLRLSDIDQAAVVATVPID